MKPYSVFIIDDDEAMRHAMLLLLRGEGFRARAFVSATDFLENLPVEKSACIITDIRMPQTSGVELVERLKALRGPAWPIIAVTGHGDVSLAVQLMKAGVVDFIEKPFDPNRILEAVRSCINQMSGAEAERNMKDATCARLATLTPRERQVFDALIEGKSNKMIALDLEISPRTVEIFRAKLMQKMQAHSLPELVRMGMRAASGPIG
ncbi:response regulator FixJ [Brevundimonas nasdae]|uniref:Response regulator n=1 Tax=Brevundimonas nasdae TaxID=172043 RepID=A0ABX8TDT7_9CAUL|nr:response regulator FixJ [Brevundimonas nasdae]QYC09352.1 response regulator [Brevundimonas nasdae]QYC15400.1 response regulator [Brevundimonas nasdae]